MTDRTREFIAATHGTTGRKGKRRLIEAVMELLAESWRSWFDTRSNQP